MMSERDALLRAIIAFPDDDTPRLAYADWLDEHEAQVQGASNGYAARATFIRVQHELDAMPPDLAAAARKMVVKQKWSLAAFLSTPLTACEVAAREYPLLTANEAEWRRCGVPCRNCLGSKTCEYRDGQGVRMCAACDGSGDAGGLLRKHAYMRTDFRARSVAELGRDFSGTFDPPEVVRVDWRCGFPNRVTVPVITDLTTYAAPSATQTPTPSSWLLAVVAHHPVTEVRALDCEPQPWHEEISGIPNQVKGRWFFAFVDMLARLGRYQHHLPPGLEKPEYWGGDVVWYNETPTYPNRDAAVTALGRAFALWARKHAEGNP